MAGPWEEYGGAGPTSKERQTNASIGSSEASAASSRVSAAKGSAELPYVAPKAAADLEGDLLRNLKLRQEINRARKGERLGKDERSDLEGLVTSFGMFEKLTRTFKDDYAGAALDTLGSAENAVQRKFSGFGTPGQASWWQEMARLDMIERNKYFGASLTNGEKEAWAATTVTPGMDPKLVRENLKARREIVEKALARTTATLRAGGYRPAQINAALGVYAKQFSPEQITAKQDYYSSEAGTPAGSSLDPTVPDNLPGSINRVGGEAIQGFRFSPDSEGKLIEYVRSPQFTPEGYGKLAADLAVQEGLIKPEEAADAASRNAAAIAETYKDVPPEVRAKAPNQIDYSAIDKMAQENAGLGAVLMQAGKNVPESAVQLIEGITALPVDALISLTEGERYGSIKTTTDLAGELIGMAGGDPKGPMTTALAKAMEDRYGDPVKTFSQDPLGLLGDLSVVLTAGGTAGARAPGVLGKTARAVADIGKAVDPMMVGQNALRGAETLGNKISPRGTQAVKDLAGTAVTEGVPTATKNVMGLTTGVQGGEGFGRAFQAGRDQGRAGAPTARSTNFVEQMRGAPPEQAISMAENAVAKLQKEASDAYRSGMIDVSNDKTILDFDGIDQTLDDLASRAYYKGEVKDPRAASVYNEMKAIVDDWRGLDPAEFHTPEGMDALKQRLGDVADNAAVQNDRKAAGIARGVYQSVKQAIADQVPTYAATMKNYSDASEVLSQVRKTFSMNPNAQVDTQLRKLQSVLRNNANTNYGYRQTLADLLDSRTQGQLMDTLSAQSINSWTPRGVMNVPAGSAAAGGIGGVLASSIPNAPMMLDPTLLATLPLFSPRAMGEASYYAGRGFGAAERGAAAVADKAQPIADLYRKYPAQSLAAAQFGSRAQDVENQSLSDMVERYRLQGMAPAVEQSAPKPAAFEMPTASALPDQGLSDLPPGVSYDPKTKEFVGPNGERVPLAALLAAEGEAAPDVGVDEEEIPGFRRGGKVAMFNRYRRK